MKSVLSQKKPTDKGEPALREHLGYEMPEVACIGDGENDVTMFEKSGLRFAVDNATQRPKEMAHIIVPSSNCGGVSAAIDMILRNNQRTERGFG